MEKLRFRKVALHLAIFDVNPTENQRNRLCDLAYDMSLAFRANFSIGSLAECFIQPCRRSLTFSVSDTEARHTFIDQFVTHHNLLYIRAIRRLTTTDDVLYFQMQFLCDNRPPHFAEAYSGALTPRLRANTVDVGSSACWCSSGGLSRTHLFEQYEKRVSGDPLKPTFATCKTPFAENCDLLSPLGCTIGSRPYRMLLRTRDLIESILR